jgi:hypothetical protein
MTASARSLVRFIILAAAAFCAVPVSAQLAVTITAERTNYISYEPLYVTVTVTNTGGQDLVLGAPGGASWINFSVMSERGEPVTAISSPVAEPMMFRAGQALQRKFNIPRYFHITGSGGYVIKASAYHSDLQRWINSRPIRFTIQQAQKPRWEKSLALPKDHRMAGKYRRYQLFNFHDTDKSYLYVRIIDESTGAFLVTLPLNTLIPDREVQIQVGGDRSLHLLSMASPTIWVYQVVNLDGKVLKQDFYQVKRGTPRLDLSESGVVSISGARPYEPEAPKRDKFRGTGDRPDGLPLE